MNMYRGKYERAKSSKRNKNKPVILIVSLVLLLVAVAGGTVAFLRAASGRVTNTFTPGEVKITINEEVTSTSKSDISFTNPDKDENGNSLDTVPVYIRATLEIYWTDTFDLTDDGVDNPTEQIVPMPAGAKIEGGTALGSGWFKVDNSDIYYYCAPVAPGASTTVMLDTITVTVPDGSTAQCHIDVRAEAIQAAPTTVVAAAWTDIEVEYGSSLLRSK